MNIMKSKAALLSSTQEIGIWGWGFSSVVERLGSVPSSEKKKKKVSAMCSPGDFCLQNVQNLLEEIACSKEVPHRGNTSKDNVVEDSRLNWTLKNGQMAPVSG